MISLSRVITGSRPSSEAVRSLVGEEPYRAIPARTQSPCVLEPCRIPAELPTLRKPEMTTSHVVVGALLLAVTFWLTWVAHRDRIEGPTPLATPSRA